MATNWLMDWVVRMAKGAGKKENPGYMPIRHLDGTVGPKTPWYLQPKSNPADKVNSIGEIRVEAPRIAPKGIVPQSAPIQNPIKTPTTGNKTQQTTPKKESTQKVDNKPKVEPKSEKATSTKKPTTSTQKNAPESKLKPQPQTSGRSPEEVLKIQKELKAAGFDLGGFGVNKDGLDSKWGQATQKAYDAYRLKQMQESTRVKTEDDYMKAAANARSAYQGIQTPMQSIAASSWRRTPNTLWMKNGGKFINELIQKFQKGGLNRELLKKEANKTLQKDLIEEINKDKVMLKNYLGKNMYDIKKKQEVKKDSIKQNSLKKDSIKVHEKGGGINIKPENRGKFTATKKKTGKSTEELTHSKNPVTKKRAIFAQNAAKWKHKDGGHIEFVNDLIEKFQNGGTVDKNTFNKYEHPPYNIDIIGTSDFLKKVDEKKGQKEWIKALQNKLIEMGYSVKADGIFEEGTRKAFQNYIDAPNYYFLKTSANWSKPKSVPYFNESIIPNKYGRTVNEIMRN